MRKKVVAVILISTMLTPFTEALATSGDELKNLNSKIALAQDVYIDGLYDNSTLYIGGSIKAKGYVDSGASNKEVEWQVTGNSGIIDFNSTGGTATIVGKSQGKVWVMARATDGSDRAREYTVNVSPYPKDSSSSALVGKNITPILTRPFNGGDTILRVEVNKNLSAKDRATSLENYLRKLWSVGTLSNNGKISDDYYDYYLLKSNSKNIEVRVDKSDTALKNILSDVSKYNGQSFDDGKPPSDDGSSNGNGGTSNPSGGGTTTPNEGQKPEPPKEEGNTGQTNPQTNERPTDSKGEEGNLKPPSGEGAVRPQIGTGNTSIPKEEVTGGVDNIIILGGTGETHENPLIVTVEESISSSKKVEAYREYMDVLRTKRDLSFVRKVDNESYMSYIFKVSEKVQYVAKNISTLADNKETNNNDFFIEIRVDKNDKEAYEPIIEMLEDESESTNKIVLGKNDDELVEEAEIKPYISKEKRKEGAIYLSIVGIVTLLGAVVTFKKFR